MKANLFLFAIKSNDSEQATFSHLTLGDSVSMVASKFNEDLSFLVNSSTLEDKEEVEKILVYFKSCSLWCLGSIDFVSGELFSHIEQHDNLINLLEVLKNE